MSRLIVRTVLLALAWPLSLAGAAIPDLDMLPDPTAPLNYQPPPTDGSQPTVEAIEVDRILGRLKLGSVLIRDADRFAVINNERVRIGDTIEKARVVAIEKNGVTLDFAGETRELKFYRGSVKRLASGE